METQLNDKRGNRGRNHKNLVLIPGQGILEFTGKSIPPVLQVLRTDYTKQGKWSHTTWTVEVTDATVAIFTEDWETGHYFPCQTWAAALQHLDSSTMFRLAGVTDAQALRAIRALFPKNAERIDRAVDAFQGNQIAELMSAQAELADAQAEANALIRAAEQIAEAARVKEQASKLRERTQQARKMMAQGVSLADLKSLLGE